MKHAFLGALLTASCFLTSAHGDSPAFDVTITAGAHDRNNVPVCISLPSVSLQAKPTAVILTGPDGKTIAAQLTRPGLFAPEDCWREIHFILPLLNAGESLRLNATLSTESPPRDDAVSWHNHAGDFAELRFGMRPVLRYHYRAYDDSSEATRVRTYKVFHHLFSPKGNVLTTGGLSDDPDVHSIHHRGIFYGFNRISYGNGQFSFWFVRDAARTQSGSRSPLLAPTKIGRRMPLLYDFGQDEGAGAYGTEAGAPSAKWRWRARRRTSASRSIRISS